MSQEYPNGDERLKNCWCHDDHAGFAPYFPSTVERSACDLCRALKHVVQQGTPDFVDTSGNPEGCVCAEEARKRTDV